MAKVVTDNTHYTQIADKIRHYSGNKNTYKPAQLPQAVADTCWHMYNQGQDTGYGQGYEEGQTAAKAQCAKTHYSGSFLGADTRNISLTLPFYPDLLLIYTAYPVASAVPGSFISMSMDMRSADRYLGAILHHNLSGTIANTRVPVSSRDAIFSYTGGVFTFHPLDNQLPGVLWRAGVRYYVTAVCFGIGGDYSRILEQLRNLPDTVPEGSSGELVYSRAAVERAMPEQEWVSLTAAKPNWRFTLV